MKKEKTVRTYQRRTKTGKLVTVRQHTAKYDAAEAMKEVAKKKGAGDELEKLKGASKVKDLINDPKSPWFEFENNFEEGWGGESSVFRLANNAHHREVANLAANELTKKYNGESFFQKKGWESIAQRAYNDAAKKLYPKEKLWSGDNEDNPAFWHEHLTAGGSKKSAIKQLWRKEWGSFDSFGKKSTAKTTKKSPKERVASSDAGSYGFTPDEIKEIDTPIEDVRKIASALGLTEREAASWIAGDNFSGYKKAHLDKGNRAAKKFLGADLYSKLDPNEADVPLAVTAKLGLKGYGGGKFMQIRDMVKGATKKAPKEAKSSDSGVGFTPDEYKAWYHWDMEADPKNKSALKVEKTLKKQMGTRAYNRYLDEMTDSYSARGHNKALKGLGEVLGSKEAKVSKGGSSKKEASSVKDLQARVNKIADEMGYSTKRGTPTSFSISGGYPGKRTWDASLPNGKTLTGFKTKKDALMAQLEALSRMSPKSTEKGSKDASTKKTKGPTSKKGFSKSKTPSIGSKTTGGSTTKKEDPVIAYAKENGYTIKRDGTFGYKGDGNRVQWTVTREQLEKGMRKRKHPIADAIKRDFGVKEEGLTIGEKQRYAKEHGFTRGGMRDGRRIYKKNGKEYVWNFFDTKLVKL